jgi:tRNA modification GTPase
MTLNTDTIAANATPNGRGGIGIIKISGAQAFPIAQSIFKPKDQALDPASGKPNKANGFGPFQFKSHRIYYGHIVDPDQGRLLDEVLVSAMKAPYTYTREDVVEINAHGGAVVVHAILQLVLSKGARLAEPGEFTRRAFLNGRIDLTQAEAVIDVINARTQKNLALVAAQMTGKLREQVTFIRTVLIDILARVEAAIDFPDDVEELINSEDTLKVVEKKVLEPLNRLIQNYVDAHVFRDGLRVAIVGRPNVGKSSLLNQLVKKERVIVTAVPGTTRDVIEEVLNLAGIPIIVSDTAGIHQTDNLVEKIGIEKTIEHVNGADLVLFLIEANSALGPEDHYIYETIKAKPVIIVLNKIDLTCKENETAIPDNWSFDGRVRISALYDRGIGDLKEIIVKLGGGANPIDLTEVVVPNLRHKLLLEQGCCAVEAIIENIKSGTSTDLIAIHIQEAIDALGAISGENVKVDVLDQIFSRFCVGK